MNPAAVALVVAQLTLPAIPPATLDDSLEVAGEGLAARQVRSRMLVAVGVNGKGPFRFLVDSGADRTVVGSALAASLGLPPAGTALLQSVAGSSRVATVTVDTLTLGRSTIQDITAPALAEVNLGAQGILGIDALADQRLMFDFEARTITVQDTRRPIVREADEIVVTARRRKGQLILTQAAAGNTPIYAVVDTGAEMTLGNTPLRDRVFRGRRPPIATPISLISVTGETIQASVVTLPQVRLGGIVLYDVQVAFADVPPFALFGLDKQPAILLGTDLLQAFRRVSLDFKGRKIRFVLRR